MGVNFVDAVVMPKCAMFLLLLLSDNKLIDLCSLYHGDTKTQNIFILYLFIFIATTVFLVIVDDLSNEVHANIRKRCYFKHKFRINT